MQSQWSEKAVQGVVDRYGDRWGEDLAQRIYSARLLGAEKSLVLHGGGNTSVKGAYTDIFGEGIPAVFVKASGHDLSLIKPEGHPGLDLHCLQRLRTLSELSDEAMVSQIRTHLFDFRSPNPSIETLVHAFVPEKYIDHTHADSILALTNQTGGEAAVIEALGDDVIVLEYVTPGFQLAKVTIEALEAQPGMHAMVWMHHGLVTWGSTAQESYERTIELVSRAESYIEQTTSRAVVVVSTEEETAQQRWVQVAPLLRGLLGKPAKGGDQPCQRVILRPLQTRQVLDFLDSERGRELSLTPPLTTDHLIRTKAFPLWVDSADYTNMSGLNQQLSTAIAAYRKSYESYFEKNSKQIESGVDQFDSAPRVVLLPGVGGACAGRDVREANICLDIMKQTLDVKAKIASMGTYQGLKERELFAMEYRGLQHAKLAQGDLPLRGYVAAVTGAAGAIGSGISRALLQQGCHVAITDLPGERLDNLVQELGQDFYDRVLGADMDVTDTHSVAQGFTQIISAWGGVDIVVINAGLALVSSLEEMDLEAFRQLQRVNVEGTLLVLSEAARHFRSQGIGGDVVVISTKNVFAPGAKFGAYSATKAASHQLARVASLEMAEMDVRVNMVAPDAVFSEGKRKSGLWREVGPDRMRARGLTEGELEEYYRNRNLLKSKVTAKHVANAVLFFCTRQTPTTGATLPVDGGLPDATPR